MKVIVSVLLMLAGSTSLFAQLNITAFPMASRTFDVKSLSLGNAVVSLSGQYGDRQINPAGIGVEGVFQFSADYNRFTQPYRLTYDRYSFKGDYTFGNSAVSLSAQLFDSGGQITLLDNNESFQEKFNNEELFLKAGYAHSFNDNLSLGAALNYLYSGEAAGTTISAILVEPVHSWSVDLGMNYQFSRKITTGTIEPSFGMALTNFGKGGDYFGWDVSYPLPTKLQAGFGLAFTSSQKKYNRNVLEVRMMQNASKIMARLERRTSGGDTSFVAMNPFKALVKSWDGLEYFTGQGYKTISAKDQIWWHSGVEVKFLETFSLRWGLEQAGKFEEDLSYQSLGMGIDLFYVNLDYAFVFDNPNNNNFIEGDWWQLTGRIPLDGYRPKTILSEIF